MSSTLKGRPAEPSTSPDTDRRPSAASLAGTSGGLMLAVAAIYSQTSSLLVTAIAAAAAIALIVTYGVRGGRRR